MSYIKTKTLHCSNNGTKNSAINYTIKMVLLLVIQKPCKFYSTKYILK